MVADVGLSSNRDVQQQASVLPSTSIMQISSPVPPFQLEHEELRLGRDRCVDLDEAQDSDLHQFEAQKPAEGGKSELMGQWSNVIEQINEQDSDVRKVPPTSRATSPAVGAYLE